MSEEILKIAIRKLSESFDEFIGSCINEEGKPKEPSYKSIMKARGFLPPYCKNALSKKI